jgi:allantoinase
VLLHEAAARGLPLSVRTDLVTGAPARRFGLPKGRLEPGADADLALIDLRGEHAAEPLDRHRANPFAGRPLRARVVRTLLRGRTVYEDGRVAPGAHGRLLTPERRLP